MGDAASHPKRKIPTGFPIIKPARTSQVASPIASNARDYQKFLEQNILKLNHKSFHQVVVLGSSSFIPFMQLPIWSRRGVIEDLLDINIFSKMNTLLKERNAKIRDELTGCSVRRAWIMSLSFSLSFL